MHLIGVGRARILVWLVPASLAAFGCRGLRQPAAPDQLEELVAKHTQARGGSSAIESARTVAIRLRIVEPKFTVEGLYQATREGRMRIDVFSEGKRVFSEGYDGQHAWELGQGAERATDPGPSAEAALRHGLEFPTNIRGLHEMRSRGHQLVLAGRETVDRTNYHVLELRLQDGFVTYLYLSPTSYLIDRQRDVRALHPSADPSQKWIERTFEDYRNVDGRMVSFKSSEIDLRGAQLMQTTTILEVRTNPNFSEQTFARP
jgi:hypothetical protein